MSVRLPLFLLLAASGIALSGAAAAQTTAAERAGALKAWREQCSDPDIELRTGYIEQAIAEKDVSVIRICVRQALESDDADIRNLGLRAAIAANDRLDFAVEMAPRLAAALEAAGDDARKLAQAQGERAYDHWQMLQTGLTVAIDNADVDGGTSDWYPLADLNAPVERFAGKAVVNGDRVTWTGSVNLTRGDSCRLNLKLAAGAELVGTFQCSTIEPMPVRAALL